MKRILIIEDEKVLQDVYKFVLTSKGFKVFTADNGQDGLNQLALISPHMILLDIFMPVMDGKDFLRNINLADFPNTKIVVYSNLSDSETQEEMFGLGAQRFILKSSMAPQDLVALADEMIND